MAEQFIEMDSEKLWTSRQGQGLAEMLPLARFELIEGAEHVLWLTHAQELRIILSDFLAQFLSIVK